MTDTFTASMRFTARNGFTVASHGNTHLVIEPGPDEIGHFIKPAHFDALREFFRAEEDKRLGRWRWPENPEIVVYPKYADWVLVINERDGEGRGWYRSNRVALTDIGRAGRAYFDAHPDAKPWELAEKNEIWVLTGAGGLDLPWRRTNDGGWESITPKSIRRRNTDLITAGRRIWPEES